MASSNRVEAISGSTAKWVKELPSGCTCHGPTSARTSRWRDRLFPSSEARRQSSSRKIEGVRATVVEMLMDLGYAVLTASDAAAALTIVESGAHIDLLFTDVVMPGPLRSADLAEHVKERTSDVLCSSLPDTPRTRSCTAAGLTKAFSFCPNPIRENNWLAKSGMFLTIEKHDCDATRNSLSA